MSYVDKKEDEKEEQSESVLKAMFVDNTVVESPEDVIEKDTDTNRKNAFKRAYDRLQELCPEFLDRKKKKKKQTKEEFNKNLSVRSMEQGEQNKTKAKEDKTLDEERER